MKKLKKSLRNALYLMLGLVLISSCTTHIEINQEITRASYCDGTYYVITEVWVRDWKDHPITLEMREQHRVSYTDVDSVSGLQMGKAKACSLKVESCLKH